MIDQLDYSIKTLTSEMVDDFSPKEAERVVVNLLAERAKVKEGGMILVWSDFNENVRPLVDELLARMLIGKIDQERFRQYGADQIAVMSIESSGAYLAGAVAYEFQDVLSLSSTPVIIRARKLETNGKPSPAMGEARFEERVTPITASGGVKTLIASLESPEDFEEIKALFVIDDFKASGSTIQGGVNLGRKMFDKSLEVIQPMAGLGKTEQARELSFGEDSRVMSVLTALDVVFWADEKLGKALISANGFPPHVMQRATIADFDGRQE